MRLVTLPGVFQPPSDSWLLVDALRRERLPPGARALDLCTGSGVLAVAAAHTGCAHVTAVDISRQAVIATRLNGLLNGRRIEARRGDLYRPVAGRRFDLILSNPPYVPTPAGELPPRGLARAWEGGSGGRELLDRICAGVHSHLRPGGVALLVHSSVCGERETLATLRAQGLDADVARRQRGPLGPILAARAGWLRDQGLLAGEHEEMLVIRAVAPPGDAGQPRNRASGRVPDAIAG